MKRLALLGTGAMALVLTISLLPRAGDSPHATKESHKRLPQAGSATQDTDPRSGKSHPSRSVEAHDRFREQARQVSSMPQDTARENAIRELAQQWAKEVPLAAERWAKALEDPSERERALTQVCLEVSAIDPRDAIRIARANELHHGIVDAITGRWASTDFDAAFAWADKEPHGEARDRLLSRLIQSRASDAPAEAASMLSNSRLSGQAHEDAALAIVHQWFLKDPEAARQWVNDFPEGPVRERASREVQGMTARIGGSGE